ncbi:MAG: hypothetical protein GX786_11235 [Clostridiales bacterium]|nr:hypothetical protein [Clostridiales bacterium]
MKQKKYVDDYKAVIDQYGKTKYHYQGPLYEIKNQKRWKELLIASWLVTFLSTGLFLLMGFTDHEGSRQMYITLPFVLLLYPVAMNWVNVYKLSFHKKPMIRMTYLQGFLGTKKMALMSAIVGTLASIGELGFLIFGSTSSLQQDWMFFAFALVYCGINWGFYVFFCRSEKELIH